MEGRVVNGGRQSGTARLIVMEKTLSSLGNGGGAREVARFFVLILSKSKFEEPSSKQIMLGNGNAQDIHLYLPLTMQCVTF